MLSLITLDLVNFDTVVQFAHLYRDVVGEFYGKTGETNGALIMERYIQSFIQFQAYFQASYIGEDLNTNMYTTFNVLATSPLQSHCLLESKFICYDMIWGIYDIVRHIPGFNDIVEGPALDNQINHANRTMIRITKNLDLFKV